MSKSITKIFGLINLQIKLQQIKVQTLLLYVKNDEVWWIQTAAIVSNW